jgi:hypothetical protein
MWAWVWSSDGAGEAWPLSVDRIERVCRVAPGHLTKAGHVEQVDDGGMPELADQSRSPSPGL